MKILLRTIILSTFVWSCSPKTINSDQYSSSGFNPEYLDSNILPCEDFAAFTSNGWKSLNPIPESEGRWGSFNVLIEQNNEKLKNLLNALENNKFEKGSYQQLVRDFYISAMDTNSIEILKLLPLQPLLNNVKSVKNLKDLNQILVDFKLKSIVTPISVYVSPDKKKSDLNVLHIGQSGLGLPDRDYYLQNDPKSLNILIKYEEHIAKMLTLAGEQNANLKAKEILALEAKLAELQMSRTDRRNPELTYNKLNTHELNLILSNINAETYLKQLGYSGDYIICTQPDFFKGLNALLQNTSLETWKAYLSWHAINSYAIALPKSFRQEHFNFFGKFLKGLESEKPRWKLSINLVENGLSEQLGRLFVDAYFSQNSKEKISEMVENIRAAYGERIKSLSWMGDDTKAKALEKLKAFTYKIGFPEKWKDYNSLIMDRDKLIENMMALSSYTFKENLDKADKPVDKSEWYMGAHVVNAYYNPSFNEIVFPAGILQPPFFDSEADDAYNYGAIGGVIGHEFTHGFDDQGAKYDKNGNLSNWWTTEDSIRFVELTSRLSDQYSAYEALPGEFINGKMTLGENIADLGGLTIAYYAYKRKIKNSDNLPLIDGFTNYQRFFLGWAGVWQVHFKEETLRDRLLTDYHSPGNFRVIGPLSNMEEFVNAWGCKAGVGMTKAEKDRIVIW